jgi:hypothetical protein
MRRWFVDYVMTTRMLRNVSGGNMRDDLGRRKHAT